MRSIVTKEELLTALSERPLYKLTGPAEHWITTYLTGYWGLDRQQRNVNGWYRLRKRNLCVLHSTVPMSITADSSFRTWYCRNCSSKLKVHEDDP